VSDELAAMVGHGQASGKNPAFAERTPPILSAGGRPHRVLRLRRAVAGSLPTHVGEMRGVGWVILFQDPTTHTG